MRAGSGGWMGEDSRTGRFWILVIALGALVMGGAALVHRHLYADGAWFLTMILRDRTFTTFDAPRQFAHFVSEAPLYAALTWLDLKDMRVLSWIYGLTLYLAPVASLWFCWVLLGRRNRSWMVLPGFTWVALTLTTSIFIISESWLGVALFWPMYFLLYFRRHDLSTFEALFLVAGAFASIRVYEGFFIPASLLLLLAFRRVRFQWKQRFLMDGWAGGALACLSVALVMGLWWAIHPRDPGNRVSLLKGLGHLFTYPGAYLLMAAVPVILGPRRFRSRFGKALGALLVVATLAWAATAWSSSGFIAASKHADLRLLNNLLPFGLGLLPFLAARSRSFRPTFDQGRRWIFAGFTAGVLVWQVGATWVWTRFTGEFRQTLAGRTGFVTYQDANLARYGYDWGWTWPCMSVVLQGIARQPVRSVVLNPVPKAPAPVPGQPAPPPPRSWQPFDPTNPADLPKLDRYGVTYALPPAGTP